jgi:short-subunit dehydrogenase
VNKVCVVTGASSGIGRAVAIELSRRNYALVINARNQSNLQSVAEELKDSAPVITIAGSVEDASTVKTLFKSAIELSSSSLNAVFAAGFAEFGPTIELSNEVWDRSIATNLTGLKNCCQTAIQTMIDHGGGRIINVLSIAARHPFPQSAAYVASKYGAYGLTLSLAAEYRSQGIAITAFIPGSVNTPLWRGKEWQPKPEDMLTPETVAFAIANVIDSPIQGYYDEVILMPPKGIL